MEKKGPAIGSEAEFAAFIDSFEKCTLPKSMWTHGAHILVALWYLFHFPLSDAAVRIREGIKKYNSATGVANTETSGYHETITIFWIAVVSEFIAAHRASALSDLLARALESFGGRTPLFKDYYSFDLMLSTEARLSFVPPDVKPLPIDVSEALQLVNC